MKTKFFLDELERNINLLKNHLDGQYYEAGKIDVDHIIDSIIPNVKSALSGDESLINEKIKSLEAKIESLIKPEVPNQQDLDSKKS